MNLENNLNCIESKHVPIEHMHQQPPVLSGIDRSIYLIGEINDQSAGFIINEISNINRYDKNMKKTYGKKYKIKPIKLYINSYGGECMNGLAIIDAMNNSKAPIYTIATGQCVSMAVLMYLNGVKRFATKHVSFMIHGVAGLNYGKLPDIDESIDHMKHIESILFNMILNKTQIKKSKLEKVIKKERCDWWIYYDEAKELRLITDELKDIDKKDKKKK